MEAMPKDIRLLKRAFWLTKLRWRAIAGLCGTTFLADSLFEISVQATAIYIVASFLVVYNTAVLGVLCHFKRKDGHISRPKTSKIINFQMSMDLLLLAVLLHFSGGIENPFVVYFIFHMIIASILLSVFESYLQATFASLLLILLALLEFNGTVNHYCLEGFIVSCNQGDIMYGLGIAFVISSTLYLVVYMTSSISSKLKSREDSLWEANLQLQQKDRIKDEYVARVTHDIKGHLAVVKMSLDVVSKDFVGKLNEQQTQLIKRADNRTGKLINFVQSLLKLTKMRLSNKINMEVFPLADTVDNAVSAARERAEDREIKLLVGPDNADQKIFGNQMSIEEVITNILLNAIKYTPSGGTVTLTTEKNDDVVTIEVTDTGIGIPEDELPKIFDEFYRASNARATERDGTGLGLSLAKQIIERHDGKIWATSRLGQGTAVSFTLPISK